MDEMVFQTPWLRNLTIKVVLEIFQNHFILFVILIYNTIYCVYYLLMPS